MKKVSSSTQIMVAMVLGILAGFILEEKGAIFAPLGDVFILLIKMVIIPLIFFSIISGAANAYYFYLCELFHINIKLTTLICSLPIFCKHICLLLCQALLQRLGASRAPT